MSSHVPSPFTDESAEIALVRRYLRPGARVLEGGSGRGGVSRHIAKTANALVMVDPFGTEEPFVPTNNLPIQIVSLTGALATKAGDVAFIENEEWWNSITLDKTPQWGKPVSKRNVPGLSISRLIFDHKIDTVVLDVEGAEWTLIPAVMCCPKVRTLIVELHPYYAPPGVRQKVIAKILSSCMTIVHMKGTSHNDNWHLVAIQE